MENDTEVIRQQMAETRQSLSEKVEAVEELVASAVKETTEAVNKTVENVTGAVEGTVNTVKETLAGTVNTVKESVTGTVNTVKESVTDSVQSVKDALDITGYVDKHPWLVMGGCVAVGYALGSMLPSASGHHTTSGSTSTPGSLYEPPASPPSSSSAWGATSAAPTSTGSESRSWTSFVPDSWMPLIDKLKGLAIGTMSGVIGEMVMKAVPENIKSEVTQLLDDATQRLGGTPLRHQ